MYVADVAMRLLAVAVSQRNRGRHSHDDSWYTGKWRTRYRAELTRPLSSG